MLPGRLIGVCIGMYFLTQIDPQPLGRALGIFVVIYALYTMLFAGHTHQVPSRWMPVVAVVTSFAAGLIGALFGGAAGPLYVIYLNAARLTKDAFRVTITTIMLFQGLVRVGGYAVFGLYDANALMLLAMAMALPLMLAGSWFGVRLIRGIDQTLFNRTVGVVLLVSGAALIFK